MGVITATFCLFIAVLAGKAKRSYILGPETRGRVSCRLHDVPPLDALRSILKSSGHSLVESRGGGVALKFESEGQSR